MNYTLIITHGRTGSTLLQGILNSIGGWHIKGENFNFVYDLFCSYQSLLKATGFKDKGDSLSPEHPWFGVASYNLDDYKEGITSLVEKTLRAGTSNIDVKCLGFKEIRYFDVFQADPTGKTLTEYLDFLTMALHPCKLIILQRDLKDVLKSAWWADEDKESIATELSAFTHFLRSYAQQNTATTFCIDYENLTSQGKRLEQLFYFLGARPTNNNLNKVLMTKHSYNIRSFLPFSVPPFDNSRPDILIQADRLHANQKFAEAKQLYCKFINQYEQGNFDRLPFYVSVRAKRQAHIVRTSKQYKLAYFPITKSACTSVSQMLYEVINDMPFNTNTSDKSFINIHDYFDAGSSELYLDSYTDFFKFTVIRDPIERFVSGYRNRIMHHGDLDQVLKSMEIHDRPEINEFAMNLENHILKCFLTELHFQPIYLRLGNSLTIFDRVFPIEEIGDVPTIISKATGRNIRLPHNQTDGPICTVHDLSRSALEKLIEFYQRDYILLADYYTPERIREIYDSPEQRL